MSSYSALHLAQFEPVGMVVLYDQVLAADAASFDVQNIPQGYKHLWFIFSGRSTTAATTTPLYARLNNDSGTNYDSGMHNSGTGASVANSQTAGDSTAFLADIAAASATAARAGVVEGLIIDYAGTTFDKMVRVGGGFTRGTAATDTWGELGVFNWRSTAAVNRLTIYPSAGNLLAGSRLTIYGLGGASVAEVAGIDGWTRDPATWTYASASTFTVPGDQTAKFSKGTRIKLTQTTVKYLVVTASSHTSGTTTVTVTGGSDYSLANAAITDNYYSYAANPQAYPNRFAYTPTWGGFSSPPTGSAYFQVVGTTCVLTVNPSGMGTSNSNSMTLTAPIAAVWYPLVAARIYDNGSFVSALGFASGNDGSTTIDLGLNATSTGGFSSSNGKGAIFAMAYLI